MAKYPSCEIGAYYAIMRSARILDDLERIGVPGVVGAYAHPAAASGWGMVVVSLQQQYAGHAAQVLALTAQCPAAAYYTKWIIAVDDDVDPTDFNEVLWALSTRCHPSEDIDILRNTWSTGLDPSRFAPERRPYGSKVLIDACKPHRHLKQLSGDDPASPRDLRARGRRAGRNSGRCARGGGRPRAPGRPGRRGCPRRPRSRSGGRGPWGGGPLGPVVKFALVPVLLGLGKMGVSKHDGLLGAEIRISFGRREKKYKSPPGPGGAQVASEEGFTSSLLYRLLADLIKGVS